MRQSSTNDCHGRTLGILCIPEIQNQLTENFRETCIVNTSSFLAKNLQMLGHCRSCTFGKIVFDPDELSRKAALI